MTTPEHPAELLAGEIAEALKIEGHRHAVAVGPVITVVEDRRVFVVEIRSIPRGES